MAIGRIDACDPCSSAFPPSTFTLQVGPRGHVLEGSAILRTFRYAYLNTIQCTMTQYSSFSVGPVRTFSLFWDTDELIYRWASARFSFLAWLLRGYRHPRIRQLTRRSCSLQRSSPLYHSLSLAPSSSVRIILILRTTIGASYFDADGLSIPLFNFGKKAHSRTTTLMRTRTKTGSTIPDRALYARRPENNTGAPIAPATDVDVERGAEINGKCDGMTEAGPNLTGSGLPSRVENVIPAVPEHNQQP